MAQRTGIASNSRSSDIGGNGLSTSCAGAGTTSELRAPCDVTPASRQNDLKRLATAVPENRLLVLPHPGEPGVPGGAIGHSPSDHAAFSADLFLHLSTVCTGQSETAHADRGPTANRLERKHQDDTGQGSGLDGAGRPKIQPRPRRSRHDAFDLLRCKVVWRLVCELFEVAFEPELSSSQMARRRPRCHMRQIAMYLSHVVLSVPYGTIAAAFGRDRSTVAHSCAVVEDRRDDKAYDRFVERCERCVNAVFQPLGPAHAE